MKGLTVSIGADTTGFSKGLKGMETKSKKSSGIISSNLARMFAGGLVLGGIKRLGAELDRAGKLAQRFGTSAVTIQKLGTVAELNGTNFERMAKSLTDANRVAEESVAGNKRAADAFKAMGINAEEFIHMGLQDQLLALSDGFIKADESGQGFSSAQVLMGGSAKELIPLLRQGSEEITAQADAASAASDRTVDGVQKMNDMWTIAKNKVFGWGISIVETLSKTMPLFVRAKDAIQSTINLALETGIALVKGLLAAFQALKNWDGAAFKDAFHNIGMDIGKAVEDRLAAVGENNAKMFKALDDADLKRKIENVEKVEKRKEEAAKREEASNKRIEGLAKQNKNKKDEEAETKIPEHFKASDVKSMKPLSSLASVGGGGNGSFSFQSLTKAAMKTNELLQQVANNTAKPNVAVAG